MSLIFKVIDVKPTTDINPVAIIKPIGTAYIIETAKSIILSIVPGISLFLVSFVYEILQYHL